jgi:hypothetical protein
MDRKLLLAFFDDGLMSALYKAGFINYTAFLYRDIYLWIDVQIKTRNISKRQAVMEATDKFNKSERTIRYALKSFE